MSEQEAKIVLVGGPATGRRVTLPSYYPEYRVLLEPEREALLARPPNRRLPLRLGLYRCGGRVRSRHVMGEPMPYVYAGEEAR